MTYSIAIDAISNAIIQWHSKGSAPTPPSTGTNVYYLLADGVAEPLIYSRQARKGTPPPPASGAIWYFLAVDAISEPLIHYKPAQGSGPTPPPTSGLPPESGWIVNLGRMMNRRGSTNPE